MWSSDRELKMVDLADNITLLNLVGNFTILSNYAHSLVIGESESEMYCQHFAFHSNKQNNNNMMAMGME